MGMMLGKITVETPSYEVIRTTPDYEIRKYPPAVVAEVTYNPSDLRGNPDGGFMILAGYIGAVGQPQNSKPEKIAMTAPVITSTPSSSGPVITTTAATSKTDTVTMQFVLPAKYKKAEEAPEPTDDRVKVKDVEERKYGVVKFSGMTSNGVVEEKAKVLKEKLEKDGFKIAGEFLLARYNPPWTVPFLRTNEVMVPVE